MGRRAGNGIMGRKEMGKRRKGWGRGEKRLASREKK